MEKEQAKRIIETLLYMTDHPLSEMEIFSEAEVKEMVQEIGHQFEAAGSPLQVVEVAGGLQVATRSDVAPYIRRLYKERLTVRLSPSALETLSIIAYKQPIARSEVEQIRGVEASGVMDTLLERRLVKVVGRKETIGRPLLYGTTQEFLRQFGLKHLTELPDINAMALSIPTPLSDQPELPISEQPVEENAEVPVTAEPVNE
jgi:segregation and condensation protein B